MRLVHAAPPLLLLLAVSCARSKPETTVPEPRVAASQPEPQVAVPQPEVAAPQPEVVPPQPKVAAPQPPVAVPQPEVAAPQPQTPQPQTSQPPPVPAEPAAPRPTPGRTSAPAPRAGTPAQPAATKAAPPVAQAPAAAPSIDLKALTERLKATKAIGIFTKIALKNQVDDLLGQFRAYHQGKAKVPVNDLRRSYELMMMKVLSLVQDEDQPLASDIVSSREAIWDLLADPKKFVTLQV